MPYRPPLFSLVPWLSTTDDLREGGPHGWEALEVDQVVRGWRIGHPWGREDAILVIHARRGNGNDGGAITLAFSDAVPVAAPVAEPAPVRIDPFPPDREDVA